MTRPVIALLTDFGLRDHYAGAMKGVVLGICPDATLVDITHDIPPHDVLTAALELSAAYACFPPATVFLVVVDPGVGSARRAIAAEAGGYRFVGPDNGVLTLALQAGPPARVVELTEARYARATVSRTFEGRDRFAPAAAWLATGVELGALGPPVASWQALHIPEPTVGEHQVVAEVLRIDRFGNLITNVERSVLERFAAGRHVQVTAGRCSVDRVVATYADADAGAVCALVGSTGHLEVAVNGASAAETLGLGRGARVVISRS